MFRGLEGFESDCGTRLARVTCTYKVPTGARRGRGYARAGSGGWRRGYSVSLGSGSSGSTLIPSIGD